MTTFLLALTLRVTADNEDTARRRFAQQLRLTDVDELLERTHTEEIVGYLDPDEELDEAELRERISMPEPTRTAWRRWVSRMRRRRRGRRRLRVAA